MLDVSTTPGALIPPAAPANSERRPGVLLRPVDLVAIAAPVLFALVVLSNSRATPNWPAIAGMLFAASLGGFVCRAWATRSSSALAQVAGSFYVIGTIWICYSRLDAIIDAVSTGTYDRELQAIDQLIFHTQPALWMQRIQHPALTEVLLICYLLFFFWQLALGVILFARKNGDFDDYVLTLIVFYMLSYCGYALVPAIGPRFAQASAFEIPLDGLYFATPIERLFRDSPMIRDCFPSGHTGVTILVLVRAWTHRARRFFAIMLPFAVLLIFSTVYCRFHYVADLIFAIPLVFAVLGIDGALRRRLPHGLRVILPGRAKVHTGRPV